MVAPAAVPAAAAAGGGEAGGMSFLSSLFGGQGGAAGAGGAGEGLSSMEKGSMLGGLLGFMKGQADENRNQRVRESEMVKSLWSGLTGRGYGQNVKAADIVGMAIQGAMGGAAQGQKMGKAGGNSPSYGPNFWADSGVNNGDEYYMKYAGGGR